MFQNIIFLKFYIHILITKANEFSARKLFLKYIFRNYNKRYTILLFIISYSNQRYLFHFACDHSVLFSN